VDGADTDATVIRQFLSNWHLLLLLLEFLLNLLFGEHETLKSFGNPYNTRAFSVPNYDVSNIKLHVIVVLLTKYF
jgi:hypothetical protein